MTRAASSRKGIVYLVGAGPGDPKLLTIKGREALSRADLVLYDHLVSQRILHACPARAKLLYVGKEAEKRTAHQGAINARLIREARSGKVVVRLKGGDPFLFGRGGEEALALAKANIPYDVVPGVSSATAVPAYAGIPLTHRALSSSVTIITGHEDPGKGDSTIRWRQLAATSETLVCLMAVGRLPEIAGELVRHGRDPKTPCAVIEWGTCPRQRTVVGTLGTITAQTAQAAIKPPAVLILGEVVRLRDRLNWFERRPLFGRRILITRASDKSEPLADQLESLGALVEELPAIALAPVKTNGAFGEAVRDIPRADWVFFTSPEGIRWFTRLLKAHRKDLRWLLGCHIGAIGPKTASAIEASGLHVDFVPGRFSQEGMLHDLPSRVLQGKRALIFSAARSRDALAAGLRRRGMRVKKIPIYRTVIPAALHRDIEALCRKPFDLVTVTSASCVEHLHEALAGIGRTALFARLPFASIGPVTSSAVRSRHGRVVVEARVSTIEGLAEALLTWARA